MIRAAICSIFLLPGLAWSEPLVLAAASTGRALNAVLEQSGLPAATSYGASGILARQIEQGAPSDLFLSANPKWMAYLVEVGLVDAAQITVLMSNRLVLIAPTGEGAMALEQIETRLAGRNFAIADPASAPVGAYGKTALEALGIWDAVEPHLVPVRNTLATLAAVASGEAGLGLVYASDALGAPGVEVVWSLPEESHPNIRYLLAPVAQGDDPEGAAAVSDYLQSAAGRTILKSFGFLPLEGGS